jgi:hypothetical protein
VALPDDLKLSSRGAWSPVYGSLEFMTPVAELPMGRATAAEKKAYEAWRNKYQRNWVRFDPIAMQFSLDGEQLDVDVTVAPLTIQTKYAYVQSLTQGVRLPATAGDPHDALAELAVALNRNSRFFQMARLVAQSAFQQVGDRMSGTDPLAWFAGTITAYVDPDPNWKNVAAVFCDPASRENMTDAQWAVLARAPIGVQFEVSSGLELTKFLVAARSVLESTAPGMLDWQLCEHQGEHYTKLTLSEIAKDRNRGKDVTLARAIESAAIYYTTSGEALIISPNEDVLRRALDRRIARREQAGESLPTEPREWLGDSLAVQIDGDLLQWIVDIAGEHHYQSYMRRRSWSNLPILNEWKRRYPDQDPVASHERLWHVRPVCPGGGQYVWNANWQTMESTVYGHPSAPKKGPDMPDALRRLRAAKAGLTFEDNGLRARFSLSLTSPDRS